MSNNTADAAEQVGEQEELDQIKTPFGVAEAIKLYEAAFPHRVTTQLAPTSPRIIHDQLNVRTF